MVLALRPKIANMGSMRNETNNPSTPLSRACENVLKAISGELKIHSSLRGPYGTTEETRETTIAWAIRRLKIALEENEKEDFYGTFDA